MVVLTEEQRLKSYVLSAEPVVCVMCGAGIEPSNSTAGSLQADGSQAFACTAHLLRERRRWIIFWALFDTQQRHIENQQGKTQ